MTQDMCKEVAIFICNNDMVIPLLAMEVFIAAEDVCIESPVHNGLIIDLYVLELFNLPHHISSLYTIKINLVTLSSF